MSAKCTNCGREISEGFITLGSDAYGFYESYFCEDKECIEVMKLYDEDTLGVFKDDFVFMLPMRASEFQD
jgi:hypothetical protein